MATKTPTKKKVAKAEQKISSAKVMKATPKKAAKSSASATVKAATKSKKKTTTKAVTTSGAHKAASHHASKGVALKGLAHSSKARAKHAPKKSSAEEHECFWVNNGPVLRDLGELARAMHEISDDQFWYHVRPEQNDFARWVEDVFGERALARKIERTKSRTGAYRVVVAHVSLNN